MENKVIKYLSFFRILILEFCYYICLFIQIVSYNENATNSKNVEIGGKK